MIIGHIGAGLIVQYFALRSNLPNSKLSSSIPAWCNVMGATLSDILTGSLILCGIETIRSNPSITPLGLSLINIDWSHSFAAITLSAAVWATFCSYVSPFSLTSMKTFSFRFSLRSKCLQHVWGWSFASVMTHLLGDWLVHNHDMALYPKEDPAMKYGLGLWADVPRSAWFGELLLILTGASLASRCYGTRKMRSPTILMVGWHLLNYPGVFTNLPYAFGTLFRDNPNLLRLSIGLTFIASYLLPGLYVSYVLDKDDGTRIDEKAL